MKMITYRYWITLSILLSASAFTQAAQPETISIPKPKDTLISWQQILPRHLWTHKSQKAKRTITTTSGQPFKQAIRVEASTDCSAAWKIQIGVAPARTIQKGEVLLLECYLRAVQSSHPGGFVHADIYLQHTKSPWPKYISRHLTAGPKWKRFIFPFVCPKTLDPKQTRLLLGLGHGKQTLEIGQTRLLSYGKSANVTQLPKTGTGYPGMADDAAWRQKALQRIETLRKGDLTVRVVDHNNKPVSGAAVSVELVRHQFKFGSAVSAHILLADTPDAKRYRAIVKEWFNHVTLENALKWPAWCGDWGKNFRTRITLPALQWCKKNQIPVHGHVLLWPSWKNSPKFVAKYKNNPDKLRKACEKRIRETIEATKQYTYEWDVANELFTNHDIPDILGREVICDWFRLTKKLLPNQTLYYNDYDILTAGGKINTAHQKHYEDTIRFLLKHKAPIDGLAMQSHFKSPIAPKILLQLLDKYAKFGLPIQITEFDFTCDDETLQAQFTRDFMTVAFSHPAVNGFVIWGFWEKRHWRPQAALIRKDWTLKPNGKMWKKLVHDEWKTRATGQCNAKGTFQTRGFLGQYRITVTAGGKATQATTTLVKPGTTVTVALPAGSK